MSRGYGKFRRGTTHHAPSFHFDSLFKENSNRPSAARSAATVGKWGITSFTSIRTINGENIKSNVPAPENSAPKPKKFFKSRNADSLDSKPSVYEKPDLTYGNVNKKQKTVSVDSNKSLKSKRFFSSKNSEKTVLSSNVNNSKNSDSKPPIVLRICHGKSQLISSSDESESTPTPSSTPSTSTSPRTLRDTAQKSPSHMRITRSTRRSMQQDPNSSPATGDTAGESFSSFTSPKKDLDLSPQYIPAEKYELERKAMYDNLLGITSSASEGTCTMITSNLDPTTDSTKTEPMECVEPFSEIYCNQSNEPKSPPLQEDLVNLPQDEEDDDERMEICTDLKDDIKIEEENKPIPLEPVKEQQDIPSDDKINSQSTNALSQSSQSSKHTFEDDWSSDSDSNSTAPEALESDKKCNMKINKVEHKDEILEKILEKPPHETPAPVKIVISKKKGSIFKSRVPDGTKKRRALYKHKWSDDKDANQKNNETNSNSSAAASGAYDEFGFQDDPLTRISNDGEDVTSVRCTKNDKGFYTVVRNVKKAHQIQEIGEFQEFNDDVDYILDALQDNNPISTRCLSAITLASKCMVPAFRMHVRAHGTVAKFFKALHDATKDQSLGLCTATVMFVLSQDRLNMDLDRDCLELMLNLLESDVSYQQALDVCGLSSVQLQKNKQKVRELCAEIQSQGHAIHLNLDNITVGQLAMETLLSLTSKRAGEWFKEELRELGGIEHIIKTICECCHQVSDYVVSWTDALLDKLRKVDRCLRVLENVTHNNEANQMYLLKYNNGLMLDTLVKLYRLCDSEIPLYPTTDINDKESTGTVIRETLLVTLKVLINLTHHFNKSSEGSNLIGTRSGVIDASLHLLLQIPHYIPDQKKFELGVLVLMLLINLIQDNVPNKETLINAKAPSEGESIFHCDKTAVEALIVQFYQWEECARHAEQKTDAILDGNPETGKIQHKSNEEFIEETVAKLLQKAGTHMEFTFLASYIVMLLGFLIMENMEFEQQVRKFLKENNFSKMVELLKKFFNFMNLTASTEASSVSAIKATEKVIKYLEESDKPKEASQEPSKIPCSDSMDLSYTLTH
ncbi:Wings apart-like protein regulation of heterochromatin [Popillia japonica]|uniref:Wings apart-like protein regulation of heterochromatin n=1 Tax=Popillia japonica TaxID=7064 RepID=A0AAW1LSN9_POPJA